MLHTLRLILLVLVCFAFAPGWGASRASAGDRTAAEIVADLDVATSALADAAKAGQASPGYKDAAKYYCELVVELQRVDRAHAELAQGVPKRWALMTQALDQAGDVDTEITKLLEAEPDGRLADATLDWDARSARVRARMVLARGFPNSALKSLEAAFDEVVQRYGTRPELADVFYDYAEFRRDDPKLHVDLMKRFAEKFPNDKRAARARERVAQLGRVGSEFELAFKDALTGKAISTKDLRGKVLVVDFWATWCGPCMREMPRMKELYAKYKDQGVEFLGVSLDKSEADGGLQSLLKVCAAQEMTWPQYYQGNFWSSEFSTSWGIHSIPAVFVVDYEGKLVSTMARGKLDTLIPAELERAKAAKK